MKLWLHKLIDTTSMMKTSRATAELLDHLTQELGFEYYHALTVRHPGFRSSILSNAPEAWLDQYRQEHFNRIDPILDRTREIMAPFVFDFEHEGKVARGPQQTFYSNADEAGIRAGICMFDSKETVPHVAETVDYDHISSNSYNLSVSAYVEPEDTRDALNSAQLNAELKTTIAKITRLRADIDAIVAEIEA